MSVMETRWFSNNQRTLYDVHSPANTTENESGEDDETPGYGFHVREIADGYVHFSQSILKMSIVRLTCPNFSIVSCRVRYV
jgi:hypothetical protein